MSETVGVFDDHLGSAAAALKFSLTPNAKEGTVRLALAEVHLGVSPFEGVRIDALELDVPAPVSSAELATGPSAFRNRRCTVAKLKFSVSEGALQRALEAKQGADPVQALSVRVFPDHVRFYVQVDESLSAVALASLDLDETARFVLSFHDIRVFGRLPAGKMPAWILERIFPEDISRWAQRDGATRVTLKPSLALLTAWLPAAGWKVPDGSRAVDRHVALRGDRIYVQLSTTATPGLVSESTSTRDLGAFEYQEAERLFAEGEARVLEGELDAAANVYEPYGDPETGHPFALRRLAWIRVAEAAKLLDASDPQGAAAPLTRARRIADALADRFPGDVSALGTRAALALLEGDRVAAAEAYEALSARASDESDLRGRVFCEVFLGRLYAAPGEGQDFALARSAFETALALDPDCGEARRAIAEIYVRTGEPAKAVEAWTRVLETVRDAGERRAYLLRIGETQLEGLKDAEGAILTFRLAQEGDDPAAPTVAAWEGLARAYAAKGDAPAAIRQLERVAERCLLVGDRRGAARANFGIGELWEKELKRPESAMMRYEKALDLDPEHLGSLERRYRLGRDRAASRGSPAKNAVDVARDGRRYAEALVARGGSDDELEADPALGRRRAVEVLLEVATLSAPEDLAVAMAAAARAMEVDPASAPAREATEAHYGAANDAKGLAEVFGRVMSRAAPAAAWELRTRRAKLLDGAGQEDAAIEDLHAAVRLAEALAAGGTEAPIRPSERSESKPDPATRLAASRAALADMLRRHRRFPALREVRKTQWEAAAPGDERGEIAADIGRLSRELGDADGARDWYERALSDVPRSPEPYAALGELAAERGDVAAHVQMLQRRASVEENPMARASLRVQAAELLLASVEDFEAARAEAMAATQEGDPPASEAVVPADAWKVLGRALEKAGDLDASARNLEEWWRRVESKASGNNKAVPAPVRGAMALEIAKVHALRKDEASELAWMRRHLDADPTDLAAARRAAVLGRKLGPPELTAELVEGEARLTVNRAEASTLLVEAGTLWEDTGNAQRAEAAYRNAYAAVPQDESPLEALTNLLLAEGRWEDAARVWRDAAEYSSGALAVGRWRRAAVLASTRLSDAELAARCFGRLLALDPADAQALTFLAERARAAGQWAKARELLERLSDSLVDAPPAEVAALAARRAEACERAGDLPAADERWRLASSLDPSAREPWKAQKRIALALGRFADATDAAEEEARRVEDATERAGLLHEAGRLALERLADPKRAAARFADALALTPDNMSAMDGLEAVLPALEDWESYARVLREKAKLLRDPKRRSDLLRRAAETAWEKLDDLDRAIEDAAAARAAAPTEEPILALQEKLFRAGKKWDRLAPLLDERSKAATGEAREALLLEAAALRIKELDERDKAAADLEEAARESAVGSKVLELLAYVQRKRGDLPRLAAALERLVPLREGAQRAETLLDLARLLGDSLDDAPGAIARLQEARALVPGERDVVRELGDRLEAAERWEDLAALYMQLGEAAEGKEASASFRRAGEILRDRRDDVPGAVRAFRRALQADPTDDDSLAAADDLLISRGDHALRAEMYRARMNDRPDDALAREGLLSSLAASGNWTELEALLLPFAESEPVGGPSARRLILAYRSAGRWKDLTRFLEARVNAGETAARELIEAVFTEREDWRGMAEFYLRLAGGKGGRERAKAIAQAATVIRERVRDIDQARHVLRQAALDQADDKDLFEAVAAAFEGAGDMEGLRDLLLDAAEATSTGAEKIDLLSRAAGITRERLGDAAKALELYQQVLAIDADEDLAGNAAAELLIARHEWAGLVALWTDRGERGKEPKRRALYYRQAAIAAKTRLGDPFRAAAAYRAALVQDPDDTEALAGAEEALEAGERWEELASLRAARASRVDPGGDRAAVLMGAAVLARDKLGNTDRALELFKEASKESPHDPVPVDAVAAILAGRESWGELTDWLLSAAEALSDADAVQRRIDAAEVLLDRAVDADSPEERDALYTRAFGALQRSLETAGSGAALGALSLAVQVLEERALWRPLVSVYKRAIEAPGLEGQRAETHYALGVLLRDRIGDPLAGAEQWRRTLELDPSHGKAFSALESWYRDSGDWEQLLVIYETDAAFATDAGHKAARYTAMAEIRREQLGDAAGAAADLKRAMETRGPLEPELALKYEEALAGAGKWAELVERLLARAGATASPSAAAALSIKAADVLAEKLGDAERAEKLYEAAREAAAHPAEPLLGLERIYRKQSRFDKLAPVLEARGALPGEGIERARLLLEAGVLRRARLGDLDRALANLQSAKELAPDSLDVVRELKVLFRERENWRLVDECLREEEMLSSEEPPAMLAALAYERGLVARDGFKDAEKAAGHLRRAVELDPADLKASGALAEESEKVFDWATALREWQRLAAAANGSAKAELLERAAVASVKLAATGQADDENQTTITLLEDAVEADPERLESWDKLGDAYLAARRWDEARLVLGELLARTSKAGDARRTVSIYYRLGRAERLLGQTEKAAGRLRRLLAAEPDHMDALLLLSEIHRERQEWAGLAEVLTKLGKIAPPSKRADFLRELGGTLEFKLGRPGDAMDVYGQALLANPEDYDSLWRLSELAFQNARLEVFLAAWARLSTREQAPARKLALAFRAGEALRKTGRPREASREYEKALEIDTNHIPSWMALAALLEEAREWRRAAAAYDGALRAIGPKAGEEVIPILMRRGALLAERIGDYESAAADLKRAVALKPDDLSLRFRQAGVLAKAKGHLADAVNEMGEILRRDPLRPEVYRALGEIHARSQSFDRAYCAFAALQLLDPADVAAKAFLDANRAKIEQGMLKALDETSRAEWLTHADAKSPMRAGLMALAEGIAFVFPRAIDRSSFLPIDLASGTPLARMVDAIRARLGLSALSLFVRPAAAPARRDTVADLVFVDGGEQPTLVVDDTLAAAIPDRRGALFVLGKFLERVKGGLPVLVRLTGDEIDQLAVLLKKAFEPASASIEIPGMTMEAAAAAVKAMRKVAPRRARKEIEELAAIVTPDKLQALVAGLKASENRAGLLISNDVLQAAKVILLFDAEMGRFDVDQAADRIAHLKKSEEVVELLRFIASEDFANLRRTVGLTLDGRR